LAAVAQGTTGVAVDAVSPMKIRKVINKPFRRKGEGVDVAGAVNAVIAADVGEGGGSHSRVTSRQRIVQRGGKTVVNESSVEYAGDPETSNSKEEHA